MKYDYALTCPDVISQNARVHAEAIAVVCEGERLTWRELDEATNRFANALRAEGLSKGDKVALFMHASLNAFVAFWGSAKAGCVTVPLNVMLDGNSLARMTIDSDAVVVVADAETEMVLDAMRDQLQAITESHWLTFAAARTGWRSAPEIMAAASATPCGVKIEPNDIITILYTSGTTGQPKGIEHTHLSRLMYAFGFGMALKIDRYSVALLGTPQYASGTWITMVPTMYACGIVVILRKFSPQAFLAALEREHATHVFLVPAQWNAILQYATLDNHDTSSLRCLVTAGQPMAETTSLALEEAFPNAGIHEVYGFSEGCATLRLPEDAVRGKRTSVGKPLMLNDIRIIDETGSQLPPGESGEIVAHSIGMMTGYYNNPELTAQATWFAPDGRAFMRSGDIGHLDKDGFLSVSGRLKDMIKSGGINIFAVDIEQVFMHHPDVAEAAAIGLPDPKWGETPLVAVVLRPDAPAGAEMLRQWANERLAKYQRVSRVVIRTDLPRAVYGKVAKAELRAEFMSGARL